MVVSNAILVMKTWNSFFFLFKKKSRVTTFWNLKKWTWRMRMILKVCKNGLNSFAKVEVQMGTWPWTVGPNGNGRGRGRGHAKAHSGCWDPIGSFFLVLSALVGTTTPLICLPYTLHTFYKILASKFQLCIFEFIRSNIFHAFMLKPFGISSQVVWFCTRFRDGTSKLIMLSNNL